MNQQKNPKTSISGCILLICLLVTTVAAASFGAVLASGKGNPIEALMLWIRDDFSMESDYHPEESNSEETASKETDSSDAPDTENTKESQVESSSEEKTTESTAESISSADTDLPPESTAESSSQTTAPVTTEPPASAKPPVTDPPATSSPAVTEPPTTSSPGGDPDRMNDPEYFSDALFIGDSRTVGFYQYGKIEGATYFARTSMNVANCFADKKSETGTGDLNLEELLTQNRYGKIYILLGINEIGYSYSWIVSRYEKILARIQELQPDAIILIQSNMHVTKAKSDKNPDSFNNARINSLNKRLAALADNQKIFYLGFESVFDDASGNLRDDYTGDGIHLKAKCYRIWRDWILENGKR